MNKVNVSKAHVTVAISVSKTMICFLPVGNKVFSSWFPSDVKATTLVSVFETNYEFTVRWHGTKPNFDANNLWHKQLTALSLRSVKISNDCLRHEMLLIRKLTTFRDCGIEQILGILQTNSYDLQILRSINLPSVLVL